MSDFDRFSLDDPETNGLVPSSGAGLSYTAVSPSEYRNAVQRDLRCSPFLPRYVGRINPFNGKRIQCEEDWIEYRRMFVLHRILREYFETQSTHLTKNFESQKQKLLQESRLQSDSDLKAAQESFRRKNRRRFLARSLFAIVLVLVFFFRILPNAEKEAYDAGNSEGFTTGYEDGFSSGKDAGYEGGFLEGAQAGYNEGYQDGLEKGYGEGIGDGYTIWGESSSSKSNDADASKIVYVTNSGTKYHRSGCSYLKSKRSISLSEAKRLGYTACSRCDP